MKEVKSELFDVQRVDNIKSFVYNCYEENDK